MSIDAAFREQFIMSFTQTANHMINQEAVNKSGEQ